jgi:hypothetical protein
MYVAACACVADKESERLLKAAEKKLVDAEKKFKKASEDRERVFQKEVSAQAFVLRLGCLHLLALRRQVGLCIIPIPVV